MEGNALDFNSLKDARVLVVCTSSKLGFPPPNLMQFAHHLRHGCFTKAAPGISSSLGPCRKPYRDECPRLLDTPNFNTLASSATIFQAASGAARLTEGFNMRSNGINMLLQQLLLLQPPIDQAHETFASWFPYERFISRAFKRSVVGGMGRR